MIKLSLKKVSAEMKKLGKILSMSAITFSIVGCSNVHAMFVRRSIPLSKHDSIEIPRSDINLVAVELPEPLDPSEYQINPGDYQTDPSEHQIDLSKIPTYRIPVPNLEPDPISFIVLDPIELPTHE